MCLPVFQYLTLTPTDNGSVSVDISMTGSYAHADIRSKHACGDEPATGNTIAHAVTHCNGWQLAIILLSIAAAIALAIAAGMVLSAGGAVTAATIMTFTAAEWGAIAAMYGGLAAIFGLFNWICNVNKNNICDEEP